jgi:hypothetical protein
MEKAQHIGCRVTSCRFNDKERECSLNSIVVEPGPDKHTGNPADESLCGSYKRQ